jgi:hypothetical protein
VDTLFAYFGTDFLGTPIWIWLVFVSIVVSLLRTRGDSPIAALAAPSQPAPPPDKSGRRACHFLLLKFVDNRPFKPLNLRNIHR